MEVKVYLTLVFIVDSVFFFGFNCKKKTEPVTLYDQMKRYLQGNRFSFQSHYNSKCVF